MDSTDRTALTKLIKEKALELDFDICGIARPRILDKNKSILREWCEAGMNGKMEYLTRNTDKRADPAKHMPDVRSIVVTGMSYSSANLQKNEGVPRISRYAYGKRYQDVITRKTNDLLLFIEGQDNKIKGQAFVDSKPLFEKAWAVEAGLGWQGKHSIIINKEIGSFFFIGILMLNIDLEYDKPDIDHCGTCRLCIDRCPTGAINVNRTIDARKCISNLTIENRDPVDEGLGSKFEKRVFGCDICQEICPWNKKAPANNHPEYCINDEVANMTPEEWLSLTEEQFNRLFKESSISRVKYPNLKHNIRVVMKSGMEQQ
ncbi:MAG: tRNA epoxyqueuosine(34) reductase QueG [Bacteroidales bacterium]